MSSEEQVAKMVQAVSKTFQQLDIFVNNAARFVFAHATEVTDEGAAFKVPLGHHCCSHLSLSREMICEKSLLGLQLSEQLLDMGIRHWFHQTMQLFGRRLGAGPGDQCEGLCLGHQVCRPRHDDAKDR